MKSKQKKQKRDKVNKGIESTEKEVKVNTQTGNKTTTERKAKKKKSKKIEKMYICK